MMHGNIQNEQLCCKLRASFSHRIEAKVNASRNVKRSYAPVKTRSALRDVTPISSASTTSGIPQREYAYERGASYRQDGRANNDAANLKAVKTAAEGGTYGALMEKYSSLRSYASGFDEKAYLHYNPGAASEKGKPTEKKSFSVKFKENVSKVVESVEADDEGKVVHRKKLSPKFAAGLAAVTALLLMVLYTSATYSSALSEVKTLRDEQAQLISERDRLTNLLGVKDDIREIEDYAVNEIGMVKSDYVETKCISIAGGEHIEVIDAGNEEDTNLFSTLLSAMGGNLELIKDYID